MKKIFSFIFSLLLVFAFCTPAFATEPEVLLCSYTVNEYDAYVAARAAAESELNASSISTQEANWIQSNAIEDELLRRSKLTDEELYALGYDDEKISILRSYNGERIENVAELRGVFADMTASFTKIIANTSYLCVRADWAWSNSPLMAGTAVYDRVVIRWQGTNSAGAPINLALESGRSLCSVKYYHPSNDVYNFTRYPDMDSDDISPYEHASAKIQMGVLNGKTGEVDYAKCGSLKVCVKSTGSDIISEGAFIFGYGHASYGVAVSLSLPPTFGIGFSAKSTTMVQKAIRLTSSGTMIEY